MSGLLVHSKCISDAVFNDTAWVRAKALFFVRNDAIALSAAFTSRNFRERLFCNTFRLRQRQLARSDHESQLRWPAAACKYNCSCNIYTSYTPPGCTSGSSLRPSSACPALPPASSSLFVPLKRTGKFCEV